MSLNKNSHLQGGKYIIEKILGQGGFGITYLAEQTGLNRKVAIKEFFMKELCDRDATNNVICTTPGNQDIYEKCKRRFKKEAQMIASFDNPHIVRIHDVFEENETVYYVMEYITGSCLQDLIGRNGMDEATALTYIKQVGEALSYIHKKNVLHLDVKPANILVNKEGKAKLIDFGISKGYNKEGLQTTTFVAGISKGFAPLEQYSCDIEKFTPATDVYSLGATLMTLLTGQYPPEAIAIIQGGFPQCPKNVSESLWTVIKIAMSPKSDSRPNSVEEFISMVNNHRSNIPSAVSDNSAETVLSFKNKRTREEIVSSSHKQTIKWKRFTIVCTCVLLLLCACLTGIYLYDNKQNPSYKDRQYADSYVDVDKYEITVNGKVVYSDKEGFEKYGVALANMASADEVVTIKMVDNNGNQVNIPVKDFAQSENDGLNGYVVKKKEKKKTFSCTFNSKEVLFEYGKVTIITKGNNVHYVNLEEFKEHYQGFVTDNEGAGVYMFSPDGHVELVNLGDAIYREQEGYRYN